MTLPPFLRESRFKLETSLARILGEVILVLWAQPAVWKASK